MTQDVTEILFDAAEVRFGGTDMGFTDGPVTITFSEETTDVVADQTGGTLLDRRGKGQGVTVKGTFSQISLSILQTVFPSAATAAGGMAGGRRPGWSAKSASGALVLHPIRSASAVSAEDFRVPIAICKIAGDIVMGHDQGKGVPFEFTGLLDTTKVDDGDGLWEYGNYT